MKIIFPPSRSTVEAVRRILCDVLRSLFEGQDQGAEVADLWLNNPRRPLEASGTSGMKAGVAGRTSWPVNPPVDC
jgi:hypothetical protein